MSGNMKTKQETSESVTMRQILYFIRSLDLHVAFLPSSKARGFIALSLAQLKAPTTYLSYSQLLPYR